MKLLEIRDSCGHFRDNGGNYKTIDKIGKDDLLRLVNWTLQENEVEFDPYDDEALKNKAHQIIYKNVIQKLESLRSRRQEFLDESARMFLEDYKKYRPVLSAASD